MKPGAKYYEWELRGIPLRIELGPRDLDEEPGRRSCAATRARRRPVSLDTLGEDVADAARAHPGRHARRRRASAARRTACASHHVRSIPRDHGGRGRRSCTPAGAAIAACEAQVKEETKATIRVPSRRGVPLGRSADDVPEVRASRRQPRRVGEGVLTSRLRARRTARSHCEGVPLDAHRRATSARRRTSTARRRSATSTRGSTRRSPAVPHRIHYTLKANSNRAHPARCCASWARGVDVVSGGELYRALRGGFAAEDIVFGGVGKTRARAARGARRGRAADQRRVRGGAAAARSASPASAADGRARRRCGSIRRSPSTRRTDYIKTGEKGHKFGIPYDEVLDVGARGRVAAARRARRPRHARRLAARRARCRIGDGIERLLELLDASCAPRASTRSEYLDIGGGLGVPYDDEEPPDLEALRRDRA